MAEKTTIPPEKAEPVAEPHLSSPMDAGELMLEKLSADRSELSVNDLDQFLQAQDPSFVSELGAISKDSNLTLNEVEIDENTAALFEKIERWRSGNILKRKLENIFPWLPKFSLFLEKVLFRIFTCFRGIAIRFKQFGYDWGTVGRRRLQTYLLAKSVLFKDGLIHSLHEFKNLSIKLKIAFLGVVLLFFACVGVATLAWKGKLLPGDPKLFITNLGDLASETFEVKEEEGMEKFYDTIHSKPNLLMIEKVVVNIKPSPDSGPNPMAAFEILVEGLNPDVVIEVKDRESFFRDMVQRTTEEFTFDEMQTPEGKRQFIQTLLHEFNKRLTTGELRNVRLRTFILKP